MAYKYKDALLKVGGAILNDVVPGAGILIDAVNSFLPDDKKLPSAATGTQAYNAIQTLPPDQQAQLFEKEIDGDIAESGDWATIAKAHAESDAAGNSTRPFIALLMAWFYVLAASPLLAAVTYAIFNNNSALMSTVGNAWPLVLAILGTPILLLRAYFGYRTDEKKARYAASVGQESAPSSIAGVIASLVKKQS